MGIVQRNALRIAIVLYIGLAIGYLNKGVLFSNFLSETELGLVNLLAQIGIMFGMLASFGMPSIYSKFGAHFKNFNKKDYGILTLTLFVNLIGILIFTILLIACKSLVVANYQAKSSLFVHYYYLILPIGISYSIYLVFDAYLRNIFKNVVSLIAFELCLRIFVTSLIFSYIMKWISLDSFLLFHALGYSIPVLVIFIYMIFLKRFSFVTTPIKIPSRFKKLILKYTIFTYVTYIGSVTINTLDALMIAKYLGLAETGIYTTIVFLVGALLLPSKSIFRVSMPLVTEHWKRKDMKAMQSLYTKSSAINLVIILYLFLGVWICRNEIFSFLPAGFTAGFGALFFFLLTRTIDVYTGLNGYIFVTSKKYHYDIYMTLFMLIVVVALNVILIPAYGITGAAIATFSAFLFANGVRLYLLYYFYKLHPFTWNQLKIIATFTGIMAISHLFPIGFNNVFVGILVKGTILSILFLVPIYYLQWEVELNTYVNKVKGILKRKN
jgi:O-antigen/teichoic acid export membrane protein